ncbi:MAG: HD domain-containing protein [Elusimicrobiota bacterium]|nr:HD domain-containing protein [Elusimicrobiota bacterium]
MTKSRLNAVIYACAPKAYYVGGALRDGLMRRFSADIDLALPRAEVKPAAYALARALKGAAFEMDAEFCVWRVTVKDGLQLDLSALVGKDIYEDLGRRDFTINALACAAAAMPAIETKTSGGKKFILLKAAKKDLIDLNGGAADIKKKIIRANAKDVFEEDPLRLLRAYRAAAELGFKIAAPTAALIKTRGALIKQSAGERVQDELKKIFACAGAKKNLLALEGAGLLTAIFPALAAQKGCARVYYGAGGVFTHTLNVVDRVEFLLANLKTAFPKFHKKLLPFAQDGALYKTAALLHDIAKPKTAKMQGGRLRFFHHEEEGAKMAEAALKNLKYPAAQTRLICKMIAYHLRPSNLAANEIITDRGVYNFFRELGEAAVPMLLLCWADYTSHITPAQVRRLVKRYALPVMTIEEGKKKGVAGKTLRHMQVVNFLFGKYFNEAGKLVRPQKLVDGKDVMAVLRLPAGPKVGAALEALRLAQVEGAVKDRAGALAWLTARRAELI